jgi:hypothetical protein
MFDAIQYMKDVLNAKLENYFQHMLSDDELRMYVNKHTIAKMLDVSEALLEKDRFFSRESVMAVEAPFSSGKRLWKYPEIKAEVAKYQQEKGLSVTNKRAAKNSRKEKVA